MHPLRLSPIWAVDRARQHQGVLPVDSQYLPVSTGVGGAVVARKRSPARKHAGKVEISKAISCFHIINLLDLFA